MKYWTIALLLLSACGTGSGNSGGDEGPNGGETVAQQASVILSEAVAQVKAMPEVFPEVDLSDLDKAVARARIRVRPKTYAGGVETDAVNNGYDVIELNSSRWNRIFPAERKTALLLHEVFGLMGLEASANYSVSNRILIEGRFQSERTYQCQDLAANICTLRLEHDGANHAFAIYNLNCPTGTIEGLGRRNQFNYFDGRSYSAYSRCSFPQNPDQPGQCSATNAPEGEYGTLVFQPGYRFYFTGRFMGAERRVDCRGI